MSGFGTTKGTSIEIDEHDSSPARRPALWQLGFRPFYLLASLFATASIPLWAAQYTGLLSLSYLPEPLWHVHEMLFGFAMAVIAGFLFTAVRNWTNRSTPTGGWLIAVVLLWVAGRVLILTPWAWLSALVNAAFPLAVALGIGIPLVRARNRRNYFFIALLTLIAGAAIYVHLTLMLKWSLPAWVGVRVALDLVLLIVAVMAGRVIPMFTNNAIAGANARRHVLIEHACIALVLVLALFDAMQFVGSFLAVLLATAAAAHSTRWWLWNPVRTLRVPLVWILHLSYAWIPVHFALRALSELHLLPSTLASHALTAGAIGGLVIGMMTRTAKGHTGRPLQADAADTAAYALIFAAAATRVFGPMSLPDWYTGWVLISAGAWSAGFGIYAIRYWGPLTQARIDGNAG